MKTFDNVTLYSDEVSTIKHRSDCDTSVDFAGAKLDVPMICSPMPDICNGEMANTLCRAGALGIIHRFQTINEQIAEFSSTKLEGDYFPIIGCAIGVTGDFLERFERLWNCGCTIFCLDTANGANIQVKIALEAIKNLWTSWTDHKKPFVIAGNVATARAYTYLAELRVDAVRVGIAGGSVCETRNETGIYIPTLESVYQCSQVQKENWPLIIADGGIRIPSDMNKALACGADLIMAGKIFAGYEETAGGTLELDGRLYKHYRGSASYSVQQEYRNEKPDFKEGRETLVPYANQSVLKVLKRFKSGLQGSMAYANALTLQEYRNHIIVADLGD